MINYILYYSIKWTKQLRWLAQASIVILPAIVLLVVIYTA